MSESAIGDQFCNEAKAEILGDAKAIPEPKSPISSGWRGHLNGYIENTKGARIQVSEVTLRLDSDTAWALANQLTDRAIKEANAVEGEQVKALSNLGAALGRLLDHHAANNGGREVVNP
jgi:hypothetical protein